MYTSTVRKCRVCGCTEDTTGLPDGRYWVSWSLCSECVRKNPSCARSEELAYYKSREGLTWLK